VRGEEEIKTMEEITKLILAILVGGLIGTERQFRHGIGLRTMMLVSLEATIFTMWSYNPGFWGGDERRIAAAVVSGVGFLGAGMIMRNEQGVIGLTTAATVWLVAALGMGIGIGEFTTVLVGTGLILIILWGIPHLRFLVKARQTLYYDVIFRIDDRQVPDLAELLGAHNLDVSANTLAKKNGGMQCTWQAYGSPAAHEQLQQALLADPNVTEFRAI